jgi:hypothetical protein
MNPTPPVAKARLVKQTKFPGNEFREIFCSVSDAHNHRTAQSHAQLQNPEICDRLAHFSEYAR